MNRESMHRDRDIAVIDSGVNPLHPHVGEVSGGHGYELDDNGKIRETGNFMDEHGHGTAICGIIREKAPLSGIYAVKIFKRELTASIKQLVEALTWCMEKKFRIIHLSLGVDDEAHIPTLESLCKQAQDNDTLIFASAKGPDHHIYPAAFDSVMGIYWEKRCKENQWVYHPDACVQFGTYGFPRPIPGVPQEHNFKGHSFAAAHMTGMAAGLLEQHPEKPASWVKQTLSCMDRVDYKFKG